METFPIPKDELQALKDVWSRSETVDWDAYDRLKARVLATIFETEADYDLSLRGGKRD